MLAVHYGNTFSIITFRTMLGFWHPLQSDRSSSLCWYTLGGLSSFLSWAELHHFTKATPNHETWHTTLKQEDGSIPSEVLFLDWCNYAASRCYRPPPPPNKPGFSKREANILPEVVVWQRKSRSWFYIYIALTFFRNVKSLCNVFKENRVNKLQKCF